MSFTELKPQGDDQSCPASEINCKGSKYECRYERSSETDVACLVLSYVGQNFSYYSLNYC